MAEAGPQVPDIPAPPPPAAQPNLTQQVQQPAQSAQVQQPTQHGQQVVHLIGHILNQNF